MTTSACSQQDTEGNTPAENYCLDDVTPSVAVVTEFQNYPFTIYVGEDIGSQLEVGNVYVFTINPIVTDDSKDYLENLNLSSLA